MNQIKVIKWILAIGFLATLSYIVFQSVIVYKRNQQIRQLKEDYAEINRINYGLFNLQSWKDIAFQTFSSHLENFTVSSNALDQVEKEFRTYLYGIYDKHIASGKLFDKTFTDAEKEGKVNKLILKLFKDNIKTQITALKIKEHIPDMAKQLAKEIKKKEPDFRAIMQKELSTILQYQDKYPYTDPRMEYYKKMNCDDIDCTNKALIKSLGQLQTIQKEKIKWVYISILSVLVALSFLYAFIGSSFWVTGVTIFSILLLLMGISLPMIILDARLNSFTFNLFETDLTFKEQVLFYQNKSILDVAQNLIDSRGWDLKLVGYLVICFSVIFPVIKLVLSAAYLQSQRLRRSKLVQNMIYLLGKWSMADVFVVALFMTYIGFYGLLNNQLDAIKHNKGGFAVETVNYTSLASGALFFTTYCILSIVLGIVINNLDKKEKNHIANSL